MILEALDYAATWPLTPSPFRRHIASSVSLLARARRCKAAWAPHEEMSKAHMLEAINTLRQRRTVVVLGSGLLRDVPIKALSKTFDTVVLVDLVHLSSVRLRLAAQGVRNARLIHRDLSGFDAAMTGETVEPLAFLRQVPYLDLVISANLLSQIGVGARRRLEADGKTGEIDAVLPRLIAAHLEGLAAQPCRTCLVTDIAYAVSSADGRVVEDGDLLSGLTIPPHAQSWEWPVVPFGEDRRNIQAVHRVIAA